MKTRLQHKVAILAFTGWIISLVLGSALWMGQPAWAQDSIGEWDTPVNISRSSGATAPQMVGDSAGRLHAIWTDTAYEGYVYNRFENGAWGTPFSAVFPFGVYQARLVAGPTGFIHAFWIDENRALFTSRTPAESMGLFNNWASTAQLAETALNYDVEIDALGNLHVLYLRPGQSPGLPAGVYYRRSASQGENWSVADNLEASDYYRNTAAENSHLDIASYLKPDGATTAIFAAWDNRLLKRVHLASSADGGETWDAPQEIDRPTSQGNTAPFNLSVSPRPGEVLLVWQIGQPGECTQSFQISTDDGKTWDAPQEMLLGLPSCADENRFITGFSAAVPALLISTVQDQVYISAWNGNAWSEAQIQRNLYNFINPDTLSQVDFRCRQPVLIPPDRLYIVGCDIAAGGDIWVTSRTVGNVETWYPPAPLWSPAISLTSIPAVIQSPSVVTDLDGRVHVFWTQISETNQGHQSDIYYSRQEGGRWSRPLIILLSPESSSAHPSVTLDNSGRIHAIWSATDTGEIFYSWANAANSVSSQEWAAPFSLPTPRGAAASPDILVDDAGILYVAYVIPFNEQRGVYLCRSEDNGASWSNPIKIFDAQTAGWEYIDEPRLVGIVAGQLHILFSRLSLPGGAGRISLHYARSTNSGFNWSRAELVTDLPFNWSGMISGGGLTLHRIWKNTNETRPTLEHEISRDNGLTWSRLDSFTGGRELVGSPALALDAAQQVHLLQMIRTEVQAPELIHWIWTEGSWALSEALVIDPQITIDSDTQAAAATSLDAKLNAVYTGGTQDIDTGQTLNSLLSSQRGLDIQAVEPPSLEIPPAATPTTAPAVQTDVAAEPLPTPTLFFGGDSDAPPRGPLGSNSTWIGAIIGSIFAVIIVVGTFALSMRNARARR
jgi:hypothetical protein